MLNKVFIFSLFLFSCNSIDKRTSPALNLLENKMTGYYYYNSKFPIYELGSTSRLSSLPFLFIFGDNKVYSIDIPDESHCKSTNFCIHDRYIAKLDIPPIIQFNYVNIIFNLNSNIGDTLYNDFGWSILTDKYIASGDVIYLFTMYLPNQDIHERILFSKKDLFLGAYSFFESTDSKEIHILGNIGLLLLDSLKIQKVNLKKSYKFDAETFLYDFDDWYPLIKKYD